MNFISDIPIILQWYLPITIIGLLFLPLTVQIFPSFYDRGYVFSKILGILLIGYTVWLAGSLKFMPFTLTTILIVLGVWTVVNLIIFKKTDVIKHLPSAKFLLFEEVLFLMGLLFWVYIRGHEPSIHGLEKFMDFGFINSILSTSYFPPQDMWLAPAQDPKEYTSGFFINYYYFGHYITALLTRLTQLSSSLTYNLMLSTIFAFCLTGSFSIGFNLFAQVKKQFNHFNAMVSGLLTAFLVTLAGNLHTIYIFTKGYENEHPVPFWQILRLSNQVNYWYPNATRFIPNTIHEFPSYSWVVADLHGHVLDIPFVLLTLGVLLNFIRGSKNVVAGQGPAGNKIALTQARQGRATTNFLNFILNTQYQILNTVLLGLLTAVMYMTNAWDGLIYLGLSLLVISTIHFIQPFRSTFPQFSIFNFQYSKKRQVQKDKKKEHKLDFEIWSLIGNWILVIGSFFLFTFPFNRHFVPFVHGVGVVGGYEVGQALGFITDVQSPEDLVAGATSVVTVGPFLLEKGNNLSSPVWMLGVLWGFFYFNVLLLSILMYAQLKRGKTNSGIFATIQQVTPSTLFLFALIVISTGLLVVPEFFYAKDIYPGHYRANTMFKLGYQAFIMLSIVSGYTIILLRDYILTLKKSGKNRYFRFLQIFFTIDLACLILVGIYPYFAIDSYYGAFKDKKLGGRDYEGIDGVQWLTLFHPDDYEAILWLKSQHPIPNDNPPIILEAVGESYTDYARISSNTGFPTVLGWPVHEWLWRGSYDEPGTRVEEVRQIYEGTDREAVVSLLNNFRVTHIIIGKLEREKYPNINEKLLTSLGEKVFESGETAVYEVK
ncbi:MAG: DUF2298 domain-containing protein [Candidatus Roizmanbacteria bacterium]|nr:DUF2298 domain-containing protein [Candidatus Roizmanbacteria bacterium]